MNTFHVLGPPFTISQRYMPTDSLRVYARLTKQMVSRQLLSYEGQSILIVSLQKRDDPYGATEIIVELAHLTPITEGTNRLEELLCLS